MENALKCYTLKEFEQMKAVKEPVVVGETVIRDREKKLDELNVLTDCFSISADGGHSSELYERVGYVCVGKDLYAALLKSR